MSSAIFCTVSYKMVIEHGVEIRITCSYLIIYTVYSMCVPPHPIHPKKKLLMLSLHEHCPICELSDELRPDVWYNFC